MRREIKCKLWQILSILPYFSFQSSFFPSISSQSSRLLVMSTFERGMQLAWNFLLLTNLLAFVSVTAQQNPFVCQNNGNNFTSNSIYDANLNTLFSSLPTNVDNYGFYNGSVGENPDRANAVVFCRGDAQLDRCRSCVQEAITELVQSCPNRKQGVIWDEFCTLRYSNVSIYGLLGDSSVMGLYNTQNATSPDQFTVDRRALLENLYVQAASGGSLLKVAAGIRNSTSFQTIYAMVQCTPDLSSDDCAACLTGSIGILPSMCSDSIGCRVLRPTCNIRYETVPFYNQTRLQELLPSPPPPPPPPPPPANNSRTGPSQAKKDDNKTRTVIIVVVSVVVFLLIAICVGVLLRKIMNQKPRQKHETESEIIAAESVQYDFGKIRAATNDFSDANKLGEGGFGAVYRGQLPNGQEIAVKRLSTDSGQGDVEFKNEVLLVARLQHRNLVRLLGFSIEGNEKLLVYEFVQNASLDQFIFDPIKRSDLNWETRYKIIGGIARGLLYLHEESRLKIIHRDLKASNILLDGEMNPKIADFGMARLFVSDETQGNTNRIVGTYGYMSPEYAMHGHFSVKSDVFSFGVLVLEVISGQKNNTFRNGENIEDLLSSAWKFWQNVTTTNIIDPTLRSSSSNVRDILRCIHVGLLCVQENAADRPTMAKVVLMLSTSTITLPMPSEPAFFVATDYASGNPHSREYGSKDFESSKSYTKDKSDQSTLPSRNDMSITELYPR